MILKFLRGLGGGARESEPKLLAEVAVEYNGYTITPAPRQAAGGWSTEGFITREVGGEQRSQHFIRADRLPSQQDAIETIIRKGKVIIDERGDSLFDGHV